MLNESNIPLEEDGIEEEILVDEEVAITKAMWGDIGGNIENQTDLKNALDAKQDSLTEAQLNAVNSGITAEKVTTYDGYADQIASKANQSALNAEATTREQADTALGTRIDNEALARQQADNGLQTQIDAITSKSDVVDVVANYAALQAYDTSSLGNNDVIKVLDDETHEDALTYYRWSTTTQTWTYIGQEAPYYSKGQMDVMLQGKQDKLTAGANIQISNNTISATDTTYTAGNGLNLNSTEFSADTDVLATKEDLEGYYTKPETDNLLAPKLEAEVVAELPTTGEEGKLYLTPKAHTTQTATGNPITATVAEDAGAIESFQLDGDTFQQSYSGSNLLNAVPATSGYLNGLSATIENDGSIHLTGVSTANYSNFLATQVKTLAAGNYVLSADKNLPFKINLRVVYSDSTTETFYRESELDLPISLAKQVTSFYIYAGSTISGTTYDETFKAWLSSGSTATAYEPYVGGTASPNPEYPQAIQTVTGEQTVEIVGRNLFDKNDVVNGLPSASDGAIIQTTGIGRTSGFIRIKPSTSYSHTGHPNGWATIAWYRADKSFISRIDNATTTTSPTEAAFARVSCTSTNLNTCQFEEGQPTDYAPYSRQTLPLDLGSIELCKLGGYQDYIYKDGDDWKIHKATGKYTFNGQEAWDYDQNTPRLYLSSSALADIGITPVFPGSNSTLPTGITNKFIAKTFVDFYTNAESNGFAMSTSAQNFQIGSKAWASEQSAKADTNGLIWYYALKSTAITDTTITDQTLITQLEAIRTASLQNGANTITNTATGSNLAGDMEIGYYGYNPTNRYDKWLWLDINNEYEQIGS